MKKIISILLCMMMLATAAVSFTGCGDDELAIGSSSKAKAMTITITTIYDDYDASNPAQVEALKMVQDALNVITETKFNTHVVIQPMKSDDYMNQIISMTEKVNAEIENEPGDLKKRQEASANRVETSKYAVMGSEYLTAANNDSVYKDALGRYQTVYPSTDKDGNFADSGIQLDIVLINSAEMYNRMVDLGYLYYMNSEFLTQNTASDQLIRKFINQIAYDHVDMDGGAEANEMYAIPNNTIYGEYSYMVVNRELFDALKYDVNFDYTSIGDGNSKVMDDFSDIENFVMDVAKEYADYRPVLNNPTRLEFLSPYGENSVMIADATSKYNTNVGAVPKVITTSPVFQSYFRTMYTITKSGEYGASRQPLTTNWLTDDDLLTTYKDEKFGVAFVKGNLDVIKKFQGTKENPGDYYVITTHAPYVDNNVYESMYAISSCVKADPYSATTRPSRCYEIIELFTTNPEWVNLLTYGVKGEHYEFSHLEDKLVVNRSEDYTFDRRYAGNLFLQYESEDMSADLREYADNNWDLGRRQNLNVTASPYAGFVIKTMTGGFEDKPVTITVNDREMQLSTILTSWAAVDAKYSALLDTFDDYEKFIKANPDKTFEDYYNHIAKAIREEQVYAYITHSHPNSPQTQYSVDFLSEKGAP